jgi:hypothetical protein
MALDPNYSNRVRELEQEEEWAWRRKSSSHARIIRNIMYLHEKRLRQNVSR